MTFKCRRFILLILFSLALTHTDLLAFAELFHGDGCQHLLTNTSVWVTSDTHFGHAEIIDLDAFGHRIRRPFTDVTDMESKLIEQWNARVGEDDTIFHLGDLAWNVEVLDRVAGKLNGHKKLILGNHDTLEAGVYLAAGFDIVNGNYAHKTVCDGYIVLSHAPMHETCLTMPGVNILGNVHGHIHEKPGPTSRHVNVSVERTDYHPILLEDAVTILRKQQGQEFSR